jgi:DNA-binding CsgD family transcriptional regulator
MTVMEKCLDVRECYSANHNLIREKPNVMPRTKIEDTVETQLIAIGAVSDYAQSYPSMPDRLRNIVGWLDNNLKAAGLAFMIERIDGETAKVHDEWMTRFALTPAEIRLAAYVVHGGTIAGYAKQHAVSRNTARNQLQAIYGKTGTHRQAELVALLLKP